LFFFFFFQAEDGIRDLIVTGVQTCALPIFSAQVRGSFSHAYRNWRSQRPSNCERHHDAGHQKNCSEGEQPFFVHMKLWTIGHSTRNIDQFTALLKDNGIKLVVDVRSLPGSKRYPQFNKESLADSLAEAGIRYEHFPELG